MARQSIWVVFCFLYFFLFSLMCICREREKINYIFLCSQSLLYKKIWKRNFRLFCLHFCIFIFILLLYFYYISVIIKGKK